jgi:hypothetical protein
VLGASVCVEGVQRGRGLLIGNRLMGGAAAVHVCNAATPERRLWSGVIAHRNSKYDGEPQRLIDQLTLVRVAEVLAAQRSILEVE